MTTPVAGTTHEIVLSDGTTTLGFRPSNSQGDIDDQLLTWRREPLNRTSIKTATGEQKWSDLEAPYNTLAQDDWVGGRAQADFAADKTKFYDSMNLWTLTPKQAILGPRPLPATYGTDAPEYLGEGETLALMQVYIDDLSKNKNVAMSFTTAGGVTVTKAMLYCKDGGGTMQCTGEPDPADPTFNVKIYSDDSGPDTVVATGTARQWPGTSLAWLDVTVSASLTGSTKYWLEVYGISNMPADDGSHYRNLDVAVVDFTSAQTECVAYYDETDEEPAWDVATYTDKKMLFKVNNGAGDVTQPIGGFFEYWGALYAYTTPATGAGKILLNGVRGMCASNSADKLKLNVAGTPWVANEWAGCVARIIDGPGVGEWRTIVSNTTSALTVLPAWDTTHTTASQYVILGSNKWQAITGVTLTYPITSVCLGSGGNVQRFYVAQGNKAKLKRARFKTADNAHEAIEENRYAEIMRRLGGYIYYSSWDADGKMMVKVSKDTRAWATDDLEEGQIDVKITPQDGIMNNFVAYGGTLLFTSKRVHTIVNNLSFSAHDIQYYSQEADENGKAAAGWNGMLYFNLGYGLERVFSKQVDDIGPNREEGLPAGRQGIIAAMCPTLDALFVALDAGDDGISSVLAYNNFGWHEIARGPVAGDRIRAVYYQTIPNGPNRLWYSAGDTIYSLKMPSKTSNPYKDSAMVYNASGELVTSWIDVNLANSDKFFHELTIVADNLSAGTRYIEAYYQTDDDTDSDSWTALPTAFTTSPSQTVSLTSGDSLSAKRIRLKLVFTSLASSTTPRLKAWALESVARMQPKFSYNVTVGFPAVDPQETLDDSEETIVPATVIAQLDTWAASHVPLTLTTIVPDANNKKVFLEPVSYSIRNTDQSDATGLNVPSSYVAQLRMIEA